MITTTLFVISIAAAIVVLSTIAWREHKAALNLRSSLLNPVQGLFRNSTITIGRDHFPLLDGQLEDGRKIKLELIADTLVFRRLPQLWLQVTLREKTECRRPLIGILARPTGAEFYSIVHDFPEWIAPPPSETSLLMRGDGSATTWHIERAGTLFANLVSDPQVKEAAITPRGVRLVRQVAQGDRGSHLLLRQILFPENSISPELMRTIIAEVEALSEVLNDKSVSSSLIPA